MKWTPLPYYIRRATQQTEEMQSGHRIRSRLLHARMALGHEMRGLLGEFGIFPPQGIGQLRRALPIIADWQMNKMNIQ